MVPFDVARVATENGGLQILGVHQVERHHQELLPLGPRVVLGDHLRQLRDRAGIRIAVQQQIQDRHEMALAAAEAAVQIGRLAARPAVRPRERPFDQPERLVEVLHQRRRHLIVFHRADRIGHALAQAQDKVAAAYMVADVDEVFEVGHGENDEYRKAG